MKLRDIMTKNVDVVSPETTLEQAARRMKELNVGSIPVCDGENLKGILTDRDITVRAVALGRDPRDTLAEETMTPNVVFAYEDQPIEEAAKLMSQYQIRRLPIVNRDQQLVGIVSLGDLSVDTDKTKMSGETLENISEPSKPDRDYS
jgi:CBS domain-containing protein